MQRVAVVTGSSSGIGRASALALAQDGFAVFLHTRRNLSGLDETARMCHVHGSPVRCATGDLASPRACELLVQAAFQWFGRVDVWFNNAGADILTTSAKNLTFSDKLELLWSIDVRGTMLLSRQAAQRMALQSSPILPLIINMAWDQALVGMEGDSGQLFGAVKAAVVGFSRSLSQSLAPRVRVNCVAPGWIKTSWGNSTSSLWDERAKGESLLNRWGKPEDVAQAIRWLASSQSEFINGHVLPINGGWCRHR